MNRVRPRQLIRRLGVDVARYPAPSTLAGHLATVFAKCGVTTVLDVGANEGQFASKLRSDVRFGGRIVSFEPFPAARAAAEARASRDPNWSVRPFALGERDGERQLLTFEQSDWNSLHPADHGNISRSGRTVRSTGSVTCEQRRLDGLWPEVVGPDEVVFLKSDTQGHDLEVLAGAGAWLGATSGLLLEASLLTMYEGEPDLGGLISVVRDHGFIPSGFFPVTRYTGSLALTTIDVCFVRDP